MKHFKWDFGGTIQDSGQGERGVWTSKIKNRKLFWKNLTDSSCWTETDEEPEYSTSGTVSLQYFCQNGAEMIDWTYNKWFLKKIFFERRIANGDRDGRIEAGSFK